MLARQGVVACFCCGILDGTLFVGMGVIPSSMTGATTKLASFWMDSFVQSDWRPHLQQVCSHLSGAFASGLFVSDAARKNGLGMSGSLVLVGALVVTAAQLVRGGNHDATYLCSFAMGYMNGIITAVTGFVRTTHVTGTVTDIGLLLGQSVNVANRSSANAWKLNVFGRLMVAFILGSMVGSFQAAGVGPIAGGTSAAGLFTTGYLLILLGAYGALQSVARARAAEAAAREASADEDPSGFTPRHWSKHGGDSDTEDDTAVQTAEEKQREAEHKEKEERKAKEDHNWMLNSAYVTALFAGMVNTLTESDANALTSHLTGSSVKVGTLFAHMIRPGSLPLAGATNWGVRLAPWLLLFFFFGALYSGAEMRYKKDFHTGSLTLLASGALVMVSALGAGLNQLAFSSLIACLAMGLQNGAVTSVTGFARTTHMTGTLTDIGLLGGQLVRPANRSEAMATKCRALVILYVCYIVGCALARGLLSSARSAGLCHESADSRRCEPFGSFALLVPAIGEILVASAWCRRARVEDEAFDAVENEEATEEQMDTARRATMRDRRGTQIATAGDMTQGVDFAPTPFTPRVRDSLGRSGDFRQSGRMVATRSVSNAEFLKGMMGRTRSNASARDVAENEEEPFRRKTTPREPSISLRRSMMTTDRTSRSSRADKVPALQESNGKTAMQRGLAQIDSGVELAGMDTTARTSY